MHNDPQAKTDAKFLKAVQVFMDETKANALATKPAPQKAKSSAPDFDPLWKNPDDTLAPPGREAFAKAVAAGLSDEAIAEVFQITPTAVGRNRNRLAERKGNFIKPRHSEKCRDYLREAFGNKFMDADTRREYVIGKLVKGHAMSRQLALGYYKANVAKVAKAA